MALITFSGLASGIDSSSLIEAILEQERATRIAPYEKELTSRKDTNSAFEELKTLLDELKETVQGFRAVNGGGVSKTVSSSDETVLSASASNSAQGGTYTVTVSQLATNASFSFNDRYSSSSGTINSSINDLANASDRTVTFTVGSGANAETVSVELTSSTTISDFATDFNSQSSLATASVVNLGTDTNPSYALVIQSKNEGEDEGTITLDSVGSEITSAGSGAFTANTLSQATNLELTLGGVTGTISRSSNTVTDLLDGISFTASDTGTATLSVATDASATESSVEAFVEKYNEIVEFIKEHDAVTQDPDAKEITNIFGPLANTSLDESLLGGLRSALSSAGISGGSVNILADLGITTNRDGTLSFESEDFQTAISTDADSVEDILANLGEELGAVNGTIAQYTRFNGLIDQSVGSNDNRINEIQDRIETVESSLSEKEKSLLAQFSRLEAQISQLQSQQNSLTSLLPQG